jgi:predicted extracellular nuclease/phosphodiesterase/alkaline phosphatase D-like protein
LAGQDDLAAPVPSTITIPAGSSFLDRPIRILDDGLEEGPEILTVSLAANSAYTLSPSAASASVAIADNDRLTLISQVQGPGVATSLAGQSVTLRGIVVGDYQAASELGGFFLQEETADWDATALTSEGLYVAYGLGSGKTDVTLGDRVSLSGLAGERSGQTILTNVSGLKVEAPNRLADTTRVEIPDLLVQRASSTDLEPYEGMWVRFPETLSVNGLFGEFRFGEVELSAGGLPPQPTNVMAPGPAAYAAEQAMALRELVLDDGSNASYRPASAGTAAAPVRDQLLRRGDTISGVEGVLSFDFGKYRLHPTVPLAFVSANPRPAAPVAAPPGQLRIASFNVLNTFSTLNAGGALTDTGLAPRGANTAAELERQLASLSAALAGLKADVIGLMEVENDADDATLAAIAGRLNAALPAGSGRIYAYVRTGLIGTDAIKVGILYNSNAVALDGAPSLLSAASFTDPLGSGVSKNRPALAQAFRDLATGEVVNVVVNHFKSKGSTDATGPDLDQLDGQSAFNATRTAAAAELARWISTNPTGNTDPDWVILGDLNAYAKEDPIRLLESAGYRNALPAFTAEPPSSYAFFNPVEMSGALDHLLISPSLVRQATAAADWNINAAEGAFRDYNLDTNSNGNAGVRDFFTPNGFRTSDHDPLLLDLDLSRSEPRGLRFAHGLASGDPYQDSVILWTRITPPEGFTGLLDVRWELATNDSFSSDSIVDQGVFTTSGGRDWTVKVEADGLSADTTYVYRFLSGALISGVGQTKTLPVGTDPVRLAVFSCANFPASEEFAAYGRAAAIQARHPYDALVHLGDYIYEYGPGGYGPAEDAAPNRGFKPDREILSLEDYRQRYAQYHTDGNLQALRSLAPLIPIWDDHETANDSWKSGAENHQSATEGDWLVRRDAALRAYHEWMPIREPALRQPSDNASALSPLTQGYRTFSFGDVLALHVLETRLTARDEQLRYPDAQAVQARIAAILTSPAQIGAYASRLGLTPPSGAASLPAFATAIAPLVSQELVAGVVQQAWGDPSRDMIGDSQLAWLQRQMASSTASWQVLGQQVLMQSMAVPAELLRNPGNPALLDRYGAPLQKLATGTTFDQLSAAERALFNEAGKIPYNLDAWDGYGVERETILQTALQLGKRLISLAGDTHNAWAGMLDTMAPGVGPAGSIAGVEFATPGVTSPGLERYLPGADAYLRARYPAIDGLDGLFRGYINGLMYADVNRRGFLDLTVSPEAVIGDFQLLSGLDPLTSQPRWISERVITNQNFQLTVVPEPATFSLSALSAEKAEGNIGSTPFTFSIQRDGDPSVAVSVAWAVTASGSNAADALDFAGAALPSGIATLGAGETSQQITLNVVGDGSFEGDESFTLSRSNPAGGTLLAGATSARGRIQNDDVVSPPAYTFSKSAESVDEGSTLAIGVSTANVPAGSPLYWRFSGVGITATDFSDGLLEGTSVLGTDGRAGFSKAIAADAINDPNEPLELRFYSDAACSQLLGSPLSVLLKQTSVGLITDGSDVITGGGGPETFIGVPTGSTLRGQGSLDRLTGGGGDDLFVLGDGTGRFYDDGIPRLGSADLALIIDFNAGDRIQLRGPSTDYRLISGRYGGVAGVRIDALLPTPEAIGFVQGTTLASLSLGNPSQFVFV